MYTARSKALGSRPSQPSGRRGGILEFLFLPRSKQHRGPQKKPRSFSFSEVLLPEDWEEQKCNLKTLGRT